MVRRDTYKANPRAAECFRWQMRGRRYGREERRDAWLWFLAGWRANTPLQEIVQTTFRAHAAEIAKAVTNSNPLHALLSRNRKGAKRG